MLTIKPVINKQEKMLGHVTGTLVWEPGRFADGDVGHRRQECSQPLAELIEAPDLVIDFSLGFQLAC